MNLEFFFSYYLILRMFLRSAKSCRDKSGFCGLNTLMAWDLAVVAAVVLSPEMANFFSWSQNKIIFVHLVLHIIFLGGFSSNEDLYSEIIFTVTLSYPQHILPCYNLMESIRIIPILIYYYQSLLSGNNQLMMIVVDIKTYY